MMLAPGKAAFAAGLGLGLLLVPLCFGGQRLVVRKEEREEINDDFRMFCWSGTVMVLTLIAYFSYALHLLSLGFTITGPVTAVFQVSQGKQCKKHTSPAQEERGGGGGGRASDSDGGKSVPTGQAEEEAKS